MLYIQEIADHNAEGILRNLYDADLHSDGYVSNTTRVWSFRPELAPDWIQMLKTIRSHLRLRPYELVTIAASRAIGCVYCMLAHGEVLTKNGFTPQEVIAILEDYHQAGLSPQEVHMMDYATKISSAAETITRADLDQLREDGLNDQQITDIALAVAARNFYSRFFNALGAHADPQLRQRQPELWRYLEKWQVDRGIDPS